MSWTVIAAALALIVTDFRDVGPCLDKVTVDSIYDPKVGAVFEPGSLIKALINLIYHLRENVSYSLLIFFCGMFITIEGFNKTGIPNVLWNLMEHHARINLTSGVVVLSLVILVLSNFASNVPTVKIGRPSYRVTKQYDPETKQRSLLFQDVTSIPIDMTQRKGGRRGRNL